MWRSWLVGFVGLGFSGLLATAQDSGPGPVSGSGSQQYDVLVIRFFEAQQGTFTFGSNGSGGTTNGGTTGGTTTGGTTTGSNPSTAPSTGTGSTSTSGNVSTSGTTTGGAARTGTTTTATSYYQSSGLSSRLNRSSGSYGFGTVATAGTSTMGNSTSGGTTGSVNGGINAPFFTTGEFASNLETGSQTGTWYAIDLGSFALFFANAADTAGNVTVTGFATPETISGRITSMSNAGSGRGNLLQAMLSGGWFIGTASAASGSPDDGAMDDSDGVNQDQSGSADNQTSSPSAMAN